MKPEDLSQNGKALFNLIEFDSDERLVAEIRKHPFGLTVIYVTGLIVSIVMFLFTVAASTYAGSDPMSSSFDLTPFKPFIMLVGIILVGLSLISTFIAAYLYKSNVVLVLNNRARDLALISLAAENKAEQLRSTGFNSLTNGSYDFSSELPNEIAKPKSATYTISTPTTGLREIVISISFWDYKNTRTQTYRTLIGELGVGQ